VEGEEEEEGGTEVMENDRDAELDRPVANSQNCRARSSAVTSSLEQSSMMQSVYESVNVSL